MDAQELRGLLLKVMGWGSVAFLLFAGWFINPTTTHRICEVSGDDPCSCKYLDGPKHFVHEIDLITLNPNPPRTSPRALYRGVALLALSCAGLTVWVSAVSMLKREYTNATLAGSSHRFPSSRQVVAYTFVVYLCFGLLIFMILDFDEWGSRPGIPLLCFAGVATTAFLVLVELPLIVHEVEMCAEELRARLRRLALRCGIRLLGKARLRRVCKAKGDAGSGAQSAGRQSP